MYLYVSYSAIISQNFPPENLRCVSSGVGLKTMYLYVPYSAIISQNFPSENLRCVSSGRAMCINVGKDFLYVALTFISSKFVCATLA